MENTQTIIYLPASRLKPYARNARTHSEDQITQIAASLREFGWTNPVLIDREDGIIAGHGRVQAARMIGMDLIPCIRIGHLTEAQKRAYVIADNQLSLNAGWDDDLLRAEIAALDADSFDVGLLGFSGTELEELRSIATPDGLSDPEEASEPPAAPRSVVGDVWILDGRHRIICGDCTHGSVVEKVLAGVRPHLMVTDPPYGVNYDANWRNETLVDGAPIGARAVGRVCNDDRADWREAWSLFPGDVAYVWHAATCASVVADSLQACDFRLRAQIIWAKSNFAIGRGDYHWQHEPCWYAVRKGKAGHYSGDRKQTTLWQIKKPQRSETGHSTQKPIECMSKPIENNSLPGQAVYDPFCGSGTTIMAAEKTGRVCYAVELNPAYVDVAVDRWEKFTGMSAVNEATGRTFGGSC